MATTDSTCQLLDAFALTLQFSLGVLALLSLLLKRYNELPRRPFQVWFYDTSKQAIGSSTIHFLNLFLSRLTPDPTQTRNPCVYYLLNLLLDTTLGVPLLYFQLQFLTHLATKFNIKSVIHSGYYGSPPRFSIFLKQLGLFLIGLLLMKLSVTLLLFFCPFFITLGIWILSPLERFKDSRYQVVAVMLVVPLIMNVVQFWLTDHFIKASTDETYEQIPTFDEENQWNNKDEVSAFEDDEINIFTEEEHSSIALS